MLHVNDLLLLLAQSRNLQHDGVKLSNLLQQVHDVLHQPRNGRPELVDLHVERCRALGLPLHVCIANSMSQ
eukprot:12202335-Heterocapsa_arctica.AAC.1